MECLSEDSTGTSEYEDDTDTINIKDSDSNLNISILCSFHIYVGEFKLNHENQCIINKILSSTMLLNIISVNFNSNSNHSNIIDIGKYLKFVNIQKKNLINNPPVKGTNLYQEVMLRKYFDIFQTVIHQYNKNVLQAYNTTNLIFKSRYPFAKNPTIEKVSESWMNQVFLRKILFNKGLLISIKHVYKETCNNCDFTAPSFDILKKHAEIQGNR